MGKPHGNPHNLRRETKETRAKRSINKPQEFIQDTACSAAEHRIGSRLDPPLDTGQYFVRASPTVDPRGNKKLFQKMFVQNQIFILFRPSDARSAGPRFSHPISSAPLTRSANSVAVPAHRTMRLRSSRKVLTHPMKPELFSNSCTEYDPSKVILNGD